MMRKVIFQPLNQPNKEFDYSQTAFGWMPTPKKEQTRPSQKESSSARTRPRATAEKRDRYADWPEAVRGIHITALNHDHEKPTNETFFLDYLF